VHASFCGSGVWRGLPDRRYPIGRVANPCSRARLSYSHALLRTHVGACGVVWRGVVQLEGLEGFDDHVASRLRDFRRVVESSEPAQELLNTLNPDTLGFNGELEVSPPAAMLHSKLFLPPGLGTRGPLRVLLQPPGINPAYPTPTTHCRTTALGAAWCSTPWSAAL
jgi:hypothetical protein